MELNNNNSDNKMKNGLYNFNTFPIVKNTWIFNHTYFSIPISFGVIGNKLKAKIVLFKCMYISDAIGHPCHPYIIQRYYCDS